MDKYYLEETSVNVKYIANKFINNFSSDKKKVDKKSEYKNYTVNYSKKARIYKTPKIKKRRNKLKAVKKAAVRLYDSTYLARKIFQRIANWIVKKGNHERSILIFYDDEEKGIRLPINNFVITFLSLVFFSLVYTGIDAYYRQKNARDFYDTLSDREALTYSLIEDYTNSISGYSAALTDYNNAIRNISHKIDYNDSSSLKNTGSTNISRILNEIDNYQRNILSFLNVASIIHREIPIGWPVAGGGRISSVFGARLSPFTKERSYHYGVDIAGPYGTPILAVAEGTVSYAGWRNGYGWFVIIDHANGYQTAYGHNSKLLVNYGDKIKRGEKIALIGNTGRTTGIHCHFEVRIDGEHKNPMPYLDARF